MWSTFAIALLIQNKFMRSKNKNVKLMKPAAMLAKTVLQNSNNK